MASSAHRRRRRALTRLPRCRTQTVQPAAASGQLAGQALRRGLRHPCQPAAWRGIPWLAAGPWRAARQRKAQASPDVQASKQACKHQEFLGPKIMPADSPHVLRHVLPIARRVGDTREGDLPRCAGTLKVAPAGDLDAGWQLRRGVLPAARLVRLFLCMLLSGCLPWHSRRLSASARTHGTATMPLLLTTSEMHLPSAGPKPAAAARSPAGGCRFKPATGRHRSAGGAAARAATAGPVAYRRSAAAVGGGDQGGRFRCGGGGGAAAALARGRSAVPGAAAAAPAAGSADAGKLVPKGLSYMQPELR